ncbi:MAG: hypothetical protein JWO56_3533 [Acidobacteria bacterium]|nr:hypothetical protein [Acidobacteriota bacterium]
MPSPPARQCAHHPGRAAYAICMSCKSSICQECATQWDGIWHCTRCLSAKRVATVERPSRAGWILLAAASLLLLILSERLMVWTGALIAGLV